MQTQLLVLMAHGSRDPRWRAPFEELVEKLRDELGEGRVALAYMEFASPTLMDVAGRAVRNGITSLRILPLFLAAGAHVDRDIPSQVESLRAQYGQLHVELLPPVGEDPRFARLLLQIARESAC
jgi:sirohydrochlorin cobaltochelatase